MFVSESTPQRCREGALYSPRVGRSYARPYSLRYPKNGHFVRRVSRRRGMARGYGTPRGIDGACSDSRAGVLSGWFHLGCGRVHRTSADVPPPWMPTWLFTWREPGVVLGDGRSMASFDPLVFRPPTSRQPNIDLCAIAFLEPLAVVAQLKTKRTGRVRAPSGTPGLLVRDGRRAFLRPRPQIC
ncbi:hypothetical protein GW17_00032363 [Ensete ventricosum]|nr:hypothetical protein GW17_00032363 [Ensete ventricosum]